MSRMAVVLPLKKGARERVRELLAHGPPFDPEAAGLRREEIFLTDREAVFVFEGDASETLEGLMADPSLWSGSWQSHAAGSVRIAEAAFAWIKSEPPEDVFFEPTPGPGDSDGGDLYAP